MLWCVVRTLTLPFSYQLTTFYSSAENYLFLLEEYLSGGTLSDRLQSTGTMGRLELIPFGQTLSSALSKIAFEGLVHRDIKPDNVMFRADGVTPVIVDFGIVRDLASSSLTGTWQMRGPGSPFYAAPEQLNNEKHMIDWRTDQFALGVLLSLCAFNMHPYSEPSDVPAQVVDRVANRSGLSNQFTAEIAKANLPMLAKMVAPWPVNRFRTANDLTAAWS